MKNFVIGLVVGLTVLGAAQAADVIYLGAVYTIREIVDFEKDPVACYKSNGKAALVAEIGADGFLTSEWVPYCLVPATK